MQGNKQHYVMDYKASDKVNSEKISETKLQGGRGAQIAVIMS